MCVAVAVAADVYFWGDVGAHRVLESLDDDRIDDECAGRGAGGADFARETFEFERGIAIDAAVVDGEFGDFGEGFAALVA